MLPPLPAPVFWTVSVAPGRSAKVATQLRGPAIVTAPSLHSASPDQPEKADPDPAAAVPLQAPPQPVKNEVASAAAVSVTDVPLR